MKYDISVWTQWKNKPIDLPEYRFFKRIFEKREPNFEELLNTSSPSQFKGTLLSILFSSAELSLEFIQNFQSAERIDQTCIIFFLFQTDIFEALQTEFSALRNPQKRRILKDQLLYFLHFYLKFDLKRSDMDLNGSEMPNVTISPELLLNLLEGDLTNFSYKQLFLQLQHNLIHEDSDIKPILLLKAAVDIDWPKGVILKVATPELIDKLNDLLEERYELALLALFFLEHRLATPVDPLKKQKVLRQFFPDLGYGNDPLDFIRRNYPKIIPFISPMYRETLRQLKTQQKTPTPTTANAKQEPEVAPMLSKSEQHYFKNIQINWGSLFTEDDLWPPTHSSSNLLINWEERYLFLKRIFDYQDTYPLTDYRDVHQRMQKKLITLLREDDSWHYQNEVKSLTQILLALVNHSKSQTLRSRIKYLSDELDLNHISIEETNRTNLRDITDKANSRFNFTLHEHELDMIEDISNNRDNSDSFSYDLYAALSMIKTFQKESSNIIVFIKNTVHFCLSTIQSNHENSRSKYEAMEVTKRDELYMLGRKRHSYKALLSIDWHKPQTQLTYPNAFFQSTAEAFYSMLNEGDYNLSFFEDPLLLEELGYLITNSWDSREKDYAIKTLAEIINQSSKNIFELMTPELINTLTQGLGSQKDKLRPLFLQVKEQLKALLQIDYLTSDKQKELEMLSAFLLGLVSQEANPLNLITDVINELPDMNEHNKLRFFFATMNYKLSLCTDEESYIQTVQLIEAARNFEALATPPQEIKKQLSPFQQAMLSSQTSGVLSEFLDPRDIAKLNMVDKEDYAQISIKNRFKKEFAPFFGQSDNWTGAAFSTSPLHQEQPNAHNVPTDNSLWVKRYNFLQRMMAEEFKAHGFAMTTKKFLEILDVVTSQPSAQSTSGRSSLKSLQGSHSRLYPTASSRGKC